MCVGGAPKAPDTSRADAEAARQRDLSDQRYTENLATQKQIADQQRADQQRQADEQKAILQEQLNRQDAAANRQYQQNQAATAAATARADEERAADLALKNKNAENAKTYAAGRSAQIDNVTQGINEAYKGFDDNYYNQFAKDYASYYEPQIASQFKDANRKIIYNYTDKGGLESSAAAEDLGRLLEKRKTLEGKTANDAVTAAGTYRNSIESQRQSLLGDALNASNIGAEVLPSGVDDVAGAISTISGKLSPFISLARSRVGATKAPVFDNLDDAFGDLSGTSGTGNGGAAALNINNSGSSLYQPSSGSSVRVVV